MTGPEHYREAEQQLDEACAANDVHRERYHLAAAQVHATLALAAATALGTLRADDHGMPAPDGNQWVRVASSDADLVALVNRQAEKAGQS